MKKTITLIILLNSFLFSSTKTIYAKYEISYGNFLPLGIATTSFKQNEKNYEIEIVAEATGLAKALSNQRVEIYKSYGKVINNILIPEKFIKIKKDNLKKRKRVFIFNNQKKQITVSDENEEKITMLDENFNKSFEIKKSKKLKELDYYASQDILSLFFNLKNSFIDYEKDKNYTQKAVGANKTKGIIDIFLPTNKIEELDTINSNHLIAYINQQIFSSEKGELLISLNSDGFCNKAILKDVLLFGDIVGEMVEFNKKDN